MVTRTIAAVVLVLSGSAGFAATTPATASNTASASTDFGIRTVGPAASAPVTSSASNATAASWTPVSGTISMQAAAALGSRWGTVTSTYRSPAHNRRVGGVRNSYHTRNRAIDIARRPGVSHAQIAAAFRSAGYRLIESLDEGDHSHFAFGTGSGATRSAASAPRKSEGTAWRMVTAPGGGMR